VLRGRIEGPSSVRDWRSRILVLGVREIPLSAEIAMRAADVENLRDPFDRIIVATALIEEAELMTADRPILQWAGNLRRLDAQR
jgi:PIN domain nuclease of toxin-antitoxin system